MMMFNYPVGTVVKHNGKRLVHSKANPVWGHVVGFDRVEWETHFETILMVRWDNGEEYAIHPNSVLTEALAKEAQEEA